MALVVSSYCCKTSPRVASSALDSRREWYRYHRLFRELLLGEATWNDPAVVAELRRAAGWWRSQGFVSEAVQHAIAAGDVGEAVDLVANHWGNFTRQGRVETVSRWLDLLPVEALLSDARLCLAQAWTLFHLGRSDQVERWAAGAEAVSLTVPASQAAGSVELHCALLRSSAALMVGDIGTARQAAERAVGSEPEGASPEWTMAIALLGATRYWTGGGRTTAPFACSSGQSKTRGTATRRP